MSFCLATFPPSKHLKTFLVDYIKKHTEDKVLPKISELAKLCSKLISLAYVLHHVVTYINIFLFSVCR